MKRITFVFLGIVAITASILMSQKSFEDQSSKYVKVEANKYQLKGLYD